MAQDFTVGETIVLRRSAGSRGRVQLGEIIDPPLTPGGEWNVRFADGSSAIVADEELLERAVLVRYPCECCKYLTIISFDHGPPGTYEICAVCSWEDDYLTVAGGANRESIEARRAEFETWRSAGMPDDPGRRPPRPEETPQRR